MKKISLLLLIAILLHSCLLFRSIGPTGLLDDPSNSYWVFTDSLTRYEMYIYPQEIKHRFTGEFKIIDQSGSSSYYLEGNQVGSRHVMRLTKLPDSIPVGSMHVWSENLKADTVSADNTYSPISFLPSKFTLYRKSKTTN